MMSCCFLKLKSTSVVTKHMVILLFFFSSDVPHEKKDREYAGIGIVVRK